MLIECSFCHATAKLPEDKEGAKVRCSSCGKVYVAREKGSRGARGSKSEINPATIGIVAAAVLGIGVFAWMAANHTPAAPPPAPAPVKVEEPIVVDTNGWDAEITRQVRGIYDAALAYNEGQIVAQLDGARIAARLAAETPDQAVDFAAFGPAEKQDFLLKIAQGFMRGDDENSPHKWKPVDGGVVPNSWDLLDVTVRITADRRQEEGATTIAESRTFHWKLSRADQNAKWKVWSWERFISDDERRAMNASKRAKPTKVTLEDGTSLFQAEMRKLDPYPDTPPEQIAQIHKAIAVMTDFSLKPKENNVARDELVAIGKPAIPLLLNQFYETKIVDDDSLTRVAMVNETLSRITGYDPGFTPMPGQNEERHKIALQAWFAWWDRRGKNFTAPKVEKDLLEEMIVPTERDKREIEKARAKSGG